MKKKVKTYDVWVEETRTLTVTVKADTPEQALEIVRNMTYDARTEAPGDVINSEQEIIGVMK